MMESWRRRCAVVGLLALLASFVASDGARAAAPELLLRVPSDTVTPGSGAGEVNALRDLAARSDNGHLFLSEGFNARISEFDAWGAFVKAWGWDVSPEGALGDTPADRLEVCTETCQAGVSGDGPGQLPIPLGIAVDSAGDIYVVEWENQRVSKFSSAGEFLLMFGGEVNKTKSAEPGSSEAERNLCTKAQVEAGDVCGAGTSGNGKGQFSTGSVGNYIAFNPVSGTIFVGDNDRIQEFDLTGAYKSELPLPGATVQALEIDAAGRLYVVLSGKPNVLKLSATGELLQTFQVAEPQAVAVDVEGTVYVVVGSGLEGREIVAFDQAGNPIPGMEPGAGFAGPEIDFDPGFGGIFNKDLLGVATNLCAGSDPPGNLYAVRTNQFGFSKPRSYVSVYGTPPAGCSPPPLAPPEIKDQYAVSVDPDGAVVRAKINPRFWADTTYYVEYGTEECSNGGCEEQPLAPGTRLTSKVTNASLTTAGVFLDGLQPGTTYHYRFVAESTGGGPIVGIDPDGSGPLAADASSGLEATFTTFPLPTPASPGCPGNAAFRTGPSARLPDCRAYELVSPLDKNNGDVDAPTSSFGFPARLYQSATSGDKLAYSSSRAFGDPAAAPYTSQYIAQRRPRGDAREGWSSEPLAPPGDKLALGVFDNQFRAFSPDLCTAWLRHDYGGPALAPGAVASYPNLYRQDLCGTGGYELLTPVKPPVQDADQYFSLELRGFSADGSHAVYVANDDLVDEAPQINDAGSNVLQAYEYAAGELRFVCILPDGTPTAKACVVGGGADSRGLGRTPNLHNAISEDGSRIYWTAYTGISGNGQIYLRIDGQETVAVSQSVPTDAGARFWSAAADGSKAIFTIEDGSSPLNDNLYVFELSAGDPGTSKSTLVAEDVQGVLGASEDATHVYFASTNALAGGAVAGKPNLYLHEEGVGTSFVMTLSPDDLHALSRFNPVGDEPVFHPARVTPDGRHAAFMSSVRPTPTGYDNIDANSGEPAAEVYLYDADAAELACVSCNPTGARPSGREGLGEDPWIAAKIPSWQRSLYATRPLSDDGRRLFFESFEELVPRDTNGRQDVYQWEAKGAGDCDEADATFNADSGGCVDLISSGESSREAAFADASPDGDDVFFTTLSSLVPQDYGLIDVYDARVGGGFPPPAAPRKPCEGEACQSPPGPPNDPTPGSAVITGKAKLRPCGKGKRRVIRRGVARCVKKAKKGKRGNRRSRR